MKAWMNDALDVALDAGEELHFDEFILDPGHDLDAALQGDTSSFDRPAQRANFEMPGLMLVAIAATFLVFATAAFVIWLGWSVVSLRPIRRRPSRNG